MVTEHISYLANPPLILVYFPIEMFAVDKQKRRPLNRLLTSLPAGPLVDTAWLKAQGISRTSVHDYVQRGWLERVAPRVYRRPTSASAAKTLRWDMAVISAQRIAGSTFHVGGLTALELLGQGHYARLGGERPVHLYDAEGTVPSWLLKLSTDATFIMHKRTLFSAPMVGLEWRRFDPGTERLGAAVSSPDVSEPWDYFLRLAGAERAAVELVDDVPQGVGFEHADTIFQGLTTLRPRLVTALLEGCASIRAKRLFLFFADRHDHSWVKHIDRRNIDLGRGKRQLVAGGRLDPRYQITVPQSFAEKLMDSAQ